MKIRYYLIIVIFILGNFAIFPSVATTSNNANFVLNSASFTTTSNSFVYTYNVSSADTANFTLNMEIYRIYGPYTYLFDTLNSNVSLANNTVVQQVTYNFTLSGSYTVKVYWFSPASDILTYKQYVVPSIIGLYTDQNANVYNGSYNYTWNWQLDDQITTFYQRSFTFIIDFTFYAQYNFTFNYQFTLVKINPDNSETNITTINNSQLMTGSGNTVQEVKVPVLITEPGIYKGIFTWTDFTLNQNYNINRMINVYFEATSTSTYIANPSPQSPKYVYYHSEAGFSIFPFIITILMVTFVGSALVYYIINKNKNPTKNQRYYRVLPTSNTLKNRTNPIQQVNPSYCSNCGSRIITNALYCRDCGSKID